VKAKRIQIAQWRVTKADPSGLTLWFDPMTEFPRLFDLEQSLRTRGITFRESGAAPEYDDIAAYQQINFLEEDPS